MRNRLRFVVALVGALAVLLAISAPTAGAWEDDWQALHVEITGEGTVTGSGGYSCPGQYGNSCSKAYDYGSVVNLVAQPKPGWIFGGWQGCENQTGTLCQVILDEAGGGDTWVSVKFVAFQPAPNQYPLSVSVSGSGKVTGSGIECPGTCSKNFLAGSAVTLLAQPGPLAKFQGWSGACNGGPTAACVVHMDAARNVTATFAADVPIGTPRTLSVEVTGSGTGSVTSGSAINCPGDCSQSYTVSADVTLTATPTSGSLFAGWSGACGGSVSTCQVTMISSRTATAIFEKAPVDAGNPGNPGSPQNPGNPSGPGAPVPGAPGGKCTITGTPGSDVLVGTASRDVICGLGGSDRLIGKGGLDLLLGGNGADRLSGGPGNDRLVGGAGRDRLNGGAGKDRLQAGAGNDRLIGGRGTDRLVGGKGSDVLMARDGLRERIDGGRGRDSARIDRAKDRTTRIERLV